MSRKITMKNFLIFLLIIRINSKPHNIITDNEKSINSSVTDFINISTLQRECIKEVPTITILKNPYYEPSGNGTNIYLSQIKVCCEGFEPYKYNETICVPKCDNGCSNGVCTSPNYCECNPYNVHSLTGECIPTCPISCLNGNCHANGTCTCNEGYILDISAQFCVPYCSAGCGTIENCTAPEVCSCKEGYILNETGQCIPQCSKNCINGYCSDPEICTCYKEFILKDEICQATCWQNCQNGKCISPDECVCDDGYTFDSFTQMCIPVCENCDNGACVAPGICECYDNYHMINAKCTPLCKKCSGRECVAPDVCMCSRDHYMDANGTCKHEPNENCKFRVNGVCISKSLY